MIEQHRRLKVVQAPFGRLPLSIEFFIVNIGRLILLLLTAFALVAEAVTLDVGCVSSATDQSHAMPENDGAEFTELLKSMSDASPNTSGHDLMMPPWLSSPLFDRHYVSKSVMADVTANTLTAIPPYRWFCVDQR